MMDELKPCPFCNNIPMTTPNHTILCETCNREILPEIWNTRPIEDKLNVRIKELEAELEVWISDWERKRTNCIAHS
jgi:hypothetical protein